MPPSHGLDFRWPRPTLIGHRRALSVAESLGPSSKLVVAARRWCAVKAVRENPDPNPDGRSFGGALTLRVNRASVWRHDI